MSNENRPSNDHYPTPTEFVRALFSVERFCGSIWEPCAGTGEMYDEIKRIKNDNCKITASTIDSEEHLISLGCVNDELDLGVTVNSVGGNELFFGYDFLKDSWIDKKDNIITNPPYNISNEIVLHALSLMINGKVAMLLNVKWLTGGKRYDKIFKETPPARVWVFSDRAAMYPKDWQGKKGSPTENYAWFIWDKSHIGAPNIGWLRLKRFKEK